MLHENQTAPRGQSTTSFQDANGRQPTRTASIASFHQRCSPTLGARAVPGQIRHATSPLCHSAGRDDTPEHPLAPIHFRAANQQHQITPQQDRSRTQSDLQPQMTQGLARPVPRAARPRFMSLETLLPSDQTYSIAGTSGVAYAGGASSGPVSRTTTQLGSTSLSMESNLDRVRRNSTSCDMDRETRELHHRSSEQHDPRQRIPTQQPSPKPELQRTDSPQHLLSLSDPSDYSYNTRDRELRSAQAASLPPSPPVPRQNVPRTETLRSTPPLVARLTTQLPTGQSLKARIPDKSLPVQEEEEEEDADEQNDNQEPERDRWNPGGGDGRPAHRHQQEVSDLGHQHHVVSPLITPSNLVATYYHDSPPSPHSRPGAPTPHTSYSHTSPSPILSGMNRTNGTKPVLPPYSPAPHTDSPYPYPFGHIRPRIYASADNGNAGLSQIDPNLLRERLATEMQIYALNNGGMVSDSTLSPSSTPFPGPQYNPWKFLQTSNAYGGRNGGIANSMASTRSSPSHQPVPLPPLSRGSRGLHGRERSQDLHRQSRTRPPPRAESTQPRDTSPELSSGEETVGEFTVGEHQSGRQHSALQPPRRDECADDEADADAGRWIDEDVGVEDATDDLLQLEFHTEYVSDPEKRRRRWKHRWETLLREVSAP